MRLNQDTTDGRSNLPSPVSLPAYFPPTGEFQRRHQEIKLDYFNSVSDYAQLILALTCQQVGQGHDCWPIWVPRLSQLCCPRKVRIYLSSDVAPYPVKAKSSSTNHLSDRKHTSSPLQIIFIIWLVLFCIEQQDMKLWLSETEWG
jgi:hypothetical protein